LTINRLAPARRARSTSQTSDSIWVRRSSDSCPNRAAISSSVAVWMPGGKYPSSLNSGIIAAHAIPEACRPYIPLSPRLQQVQLPPRLLTHHGRVVLLGRRAQQRFDAGRFRLGQAAQRPGPQPEVVALEQRRDQLVLRVGGDAGEGRG